MKISAIFSQGHGMWNVTAGSKSFFGVEFSSTLPIESAGVCLIAEHEYITLERVGEHVDGDLTWYDKLIISRVPDEDIHGTFTPYKKKEEK